MNVILEVSVPDVIKALADNKPDEAFNKALSEAAKQATTSQDDVITLFIKEYHKTAPGAKLSELFATQQLKDKVNQKSSDAEVEKVLREEVKAAVTNSYNVLRTRIDRFGVVQPNIQSLEDKMGRIMVELPGIKEPERVRKLLQGSANLEFWETYNAKEVAPYLQAADSKLRAVLAHETTANDTVAAVDSTALAATEATPDKAISAADSLAAALKGGEKKQQASSADLEQLKRTSATGHPECKPQRRSRSRLCQLQRYSYCQFIPRYEGNSCRTAERSPFKMGCFSVRIRSERPDFRIVCYQIDRT